MGVRWGEEESEAKQMTKRKTLTLSLCWREWFANWNRDLFIFLLRAGPAACGSSQGRGQIEAAAARLHLSSWQCRILNPLSEARDPNCVLMDTSRVHFCWATIGNPSKILSYLLTWYDFLELQRFSHIKLNFALFIAYWKKFDIRLTWLQYQLLV